MGRYCQVTNSNCILVSYYHTDFNSMEDITAEKYHKYIINSLKHGNLNIDTLSGKSPTLTIFDTDNDDDKLPNKQHIVIDSVKEEKCFGYNPGYRIVSQVKYQLLQSMPTPITFGHIKASAVKKIMLPDEIEIFDLKTIVVKDSKRGGEREFVPIFSHVQCLGQYDIYILKDDPELNQPEIVNKQSFDADELLTAVNSQHPSNFFEKKYKNFICCDIKA